MEAERWSQGLRQEGGREEDRPTGTLQGVAPCDWESGPVGTELVRS